MGIGCADCHMLELDPGPIASGATRVRDRRAHTFTGLDPPWGASAEVAQQSADRTRALLDRALVIEVVPAGGGDELDISVTNECFAHRVPTGVAMLRDMWVDVYVTSGVGDPDIRHLHHRLGRD